MGNSQRTSWEHNQLDSPQHGELTEKTRGTESNSLISTWGTHREHHGNRINQIHLSMGNSQRTSWEQNQLDSPQHGELTEKTRGTESTSLISTWGTRRENQGNRIKQSDLNMGNSQRTSWEQNQLDSPQHGELTENTRGNRINYFDLNKGNSQRTTLGEQSQLDSPQHGELIENIMGTESNIFTSAQGAHREHQGNRINYFDLNKGNSQRTTLGEQNQLDSPRHGELIENNIRGTETTRFTSAWGTHREHQGNRIGNMILQTGVLRVYYV